MGVSLEPSAEAAVARPGRSRRGREERKAKILDGLRKGIPRPSPCVFELNRLLSSSPVDLAKVAGLIESDEALTRAVWEGCASVTGTMSWPGESLDEAVILLGIDRFKFLASTQSLRIALPHARETAMMRSFWRHSYTVACLSDRIAQWSGYYPAEYPFLAGLYHDVGVLPLMEAALDARQGARGSCQPLGNVPQERRRFGLDHCVLGGMIALSWDFPTALIDAFVHHHDPAKSACALPLTRIVAAADEVARTRETALRTSAWPQPHDAFQPFAQILGSHFPNFGGGQVRAQAAALADELSQSPVCREPVFAPSGGDVTGVR